MNGHKTSNQSSTVPRNNHKRNIKFMYDTLDWRYNRWIIFIIAHGQHRMTRIANTTTAATTTWSLRLFAAACSASVRTHSLYWCLFLVELLVKIVCLVLFFLVANSFALIWLHVHAYAFAHRCVIYWIFLLKYSETCPICNCYKFGVCCVFVLFLLENDTSS